MATCRDWLNTDLPPGPRRSAVERYVTAYSPDEPVTVARTPARVSFNCHVDHQGAALLYACHGREVVAVVGVTGLVGCAWDYDLPDPWPYVEAGAEAAGYRGPLQVALAGDIPIGAGQASSSAVVVAVALALGGRPGWRRPCYASGLQPRPGRRRDDDPVRQIAGDVVDGLRDATEVTRG